MSGTHNGSYSASVELSLRVGTSVFPLHKVSPTRVVMRTPIDLPAGDAELVVSIDGKDQVSRVCLPLGDSIRSAFVEIERGDVPGPLGSSFHTSPGKPRGICFDLAAAPSGVPGSGSKDGELKILAKHDQPPSASGTVVLV